MARPRNLRRLLQSAVLICALADVALFLVYVSPLVPSHADATEQVARATTELNLKRTTVSNLQLLKSRIVQSEREARELTGTAMPPEQTVFSDVLQEMDKLAKASHVQAAGIGFDKAKTTTAGLREIGITANVEGQYSDVIEFLNAIERSPIFFIVDEITLTGSRAETGNGAIRLGVRLETYARVEEAAGRA
jgi:Tfp pilus assembly protein PilO